MSYEPTTWKKGDKVTSTKLNKIEQGIQGNDEEITSIKNGLSDLDERVADIEAGGSGGMSMTAVNLLHTILGEGVYGTDQSANIELLYKELSNVKPVSITASLTSRALVGMQYSELTFDIIATFDDESTSTVTDGYRVTTTGTVHSGSNTITVRYRGVTTNVTFTAEQVVTHTITYNLTDVTLSNNTTVIADGSHYSTVLSVPTDYGFNGCTVTMGGVDITDTAFGNMEILITSVTGDVVITASATKITYLTGFRRTNSSKNSVSYGYSDYFTTQNYRLNYSGISYISEYPAKNDCTLNWKITNNTDSTVSIASMAIGCIPINDDSYDTNTNFRMAYCQLITNTSNTLDAGASISGTYELRAGYQLAYVAQETQISALDIAFSGNYVADNFSGYKHLEFSENVTYGAYREVKWYSDNNETLLCTAKSQVFALLDDSIVLGNYDAVCALRAADPTSVGNVDNRCLAVGTVSDNTVTEVPYSVGSHAGKTSKYNIWHKGTIIVSDDGLMLMAPPLGATGIVIDLYIKGVTT